jgi:hypothetical protein
MLIARKRNELQMIFFWIFIFASCNSGQPPGKPSGCSHQVRDPARGRSGGAGSGFLFTPADGEAQTLGA